MDDNTDNDAVPTNRINFSAAIAQSKKEEPMEETEPEIVTPLEEEIDKKNNTMEPDDIEIDVVPESDDQDTVENLKAEHARIAKQIKDKQDAEKASVIEQIKVVVTTYNITNEELVEALGGLKSKRKGSKAKPKYRNPETGITWSGRGRAPLWIRDEEDRDQFLIPEGDAALADGTSDTGETA